jgi:pimeloyl-ACP methyl ester carboxylesterase
VYVGESLGTGVAVQLAAVEPPAAMLLRSPFTSLRDVARRSFPVLPSFILRDHFDTAGTIGSVDVPVTVLCGQVDTLVPAAQSQRVASLAPTLFAVECLPGVGHNDAVWFGPLLAGRVDDLVRSLDGVPLP